MSIDKNQFKELIQANIDQYGYHVTIVGSSIQPRYAYTIGLIDNFNYELVFAGGIYYLKDDLLQIFKEIVKELKKGDIKSTKKITIGSFGTFSFTNVDPSWSKIMLLGIFERYKASDVKVIQIVPDPDYYTLDIPDMSKEFDASSQPVWQWLVRKWDYPVPENSTVVTNLKALLGEAITEIMRYELNEWEMFAGSGPEVERGDIRVVSLGTILGIDRTILPAINLEIDKGLWRESADFNWTSWE